MFIYIYIYTHTVSQAKQFSCSFALLDAKSFGLIRLGFELKKNPVGEADALQQTTF